MLRTSISLDLSPALCFQALSWVILTQMPDITIIISHSIKSLYLKIILYPYDSRILLSVKNNFIIGAFSFMLHRFAINKLYCNTGRVGLSGSQNFLIYIWVTLFLFGLKVLFNKVFNLLFIGGVIQKAFLYMSSNWIKLLVFSYYCWLTANYLLTVE